MLVPTALLRGGRAAGRRLFPAGWGLRWVMRLVRGEGGRWILASAEELEVGAVVAVDLGADGVWPACFCSHSSHIFCAPQITAPFALPHEPHQRAFFVPSFSSTP
eukprot:COSAG03_NODE_1443_length_4075_cov_2.581457_4_plen_105_part_00